MGTPPVMDSSSTTVWVLPVHTKLANRDGEGALEQVLTSHQPAHVADGLLASRGHVEYKDVTM